LILGKHISAGISDRGTTPGVTRGDSRKIVKHYKINVSSLYKRDKTSEKEEERMNIGHRVSIAAYINNA